jgi:hypothetical protein
MTSGYEIMQEAEKSNVVQIRDYAHLRGRAAGLDRPAATLSITQRGDAPVPRPHPPYPGGIDDLPV